MDAIWVLVGIVVAVVAIVAIYYFAIHVPIDVTTPAVAARDTSIGTDQGASPPAASLSTPLVQDVSRSVMLSPSTLLDNPSFGTVPTNSPTNINPSVSKSVAQEADYFTPVPGTPIRDNQVESLVDRRYLMRGTYPGIRENKRDVVVTQPHRQTIMLCNRGGFLRQYGSNGAWECVDQVIIGDKRLGYSNTGRFVYDDSYVTHVSCAHRHPISTLHPHMQVESPFVLYLHATNQV